LSVAQSIRLREGGFYCAAKAARVIDIIQMGNIMNNILVPNRRTALKLLGGGAAALAMP
jgi:hypothetical protein